MRRALAGRLAAVVGWSALLAPAWGVSLPRPAEAMSIRVGSYIGDGNDNRPILGVGFQPEAVIVKAVTAQTAVLRTSTMPGDATKALASATALQPDRIQFLGGDGFTIGMAPEVNAPGTTYFWMAFDNDGAGDLAVGSYTGNGADNRSITGVGFQSEYMIVLGAAADLPVQRFSTMAGDSSIFFTGSASVTNRIQALEADGFQVGTNSQVNASGIAYHYLAWDSGAGKVAVGSYTGNATDNRDIGGVGFAPEYVIVKGNTTVGGLHRSSAVAGDTTLRFEALANVSNGIQALQPDGFQVGTMNGVNASGTTYHFAAFVPEPSTALLLASGVVGLAWLAPRRTGRSRSSAMGSA